MFNDDEVKLIAEIGGNHEGDFNYAVDLVHLAIESGVDSVKFQIYSGNSLVNEKVDPKRKEHFDKFSLTSDQYIELANICSKNKIDFSASIWNESQLNEFEEYLSFFKIGSGDLTAYPIIKSHCEKGKPIIISTGLSLMEEVTEAVDFICKCNPIYKNKRMLCIMQCTSSYPTPDDELNLKVIQHYKKHFKYPIGFSSHSSNPLALEYAVALGARVLEFHFTDSRSGKEFRDHKVSLTKSDVLNLKERIPFVLDSLGSNRKKPTFSEIESKNVITFRRGAYPSKNIKKGKEVSLEDFIFLRPFEGLSPKSVYKVLGKKTKRNLKYLEPVALEDFE